MYLGRRRYRRVKRSSTVTLPSQLWPVFRTSARTAQDTRGRSRHALLIADSKSGHRHERRLRSRARTVPLGHSGFDREVEGTAIFCVPICSLSTSIYRLFELGTVSQPGYQPRDAISVIFLTSSSEADLGSGVAGSAFGSTRAYREDRLGELRVSRLKMQQGPVGTASP